MEKLNKVGTLTVTGPVDVTDPCYEKGIWCQITDFHIPEGEYYCYVEEAVVEDWGKIIKRNAIIRSNYQNFPNTLEREYLGEIGVDAGLAGYFIKKPNFSQEEWLSFCKEISKEREGGKDFYIVDGAYQGFFTDSGYGDGGYDVYTLMSGSDIVGLEIMFA